MAARLKNWLLNKLVGILGQNSASETHLEITIEGLRNLRQQLEEETMAADEYRFPTKKHLSEEEQERERQRLAGVRAKMADNFISQISALLAEKLHKQQVKLAPYAFKTGFFYRSYDRDMELEQMVINHFLQLAIVIEFRQLPPDLKKKGDPHTIVVDLLYPFDDNLNAEYYLPTPLKLELTDKFIKHGIASSVFGRDGFVDKLKRMNNEFGDVWAYCTFQNDAGGYFSCIVRLTVDLLDSANFPLDAVILSKK